MLGGILHCGYLRGRNDDVHLGIFETCNSNHKTSVHKVASYDRTFMPGERTEEHHYFLTDNLLG